MLLPSHVSTYLESITQTPSKLFDVKEAKSAQQRVWIVKLSSSSSCIDETWKHALEFGRDRVVVRVWQKACRWWNLNQNGSVQCAAQAEIFGYRMARQIFEKDLNIRIPRVLHFELDEERPWAVMEYVGYESALFDGREVDESWVTSMIKVREEYGFLEPHPRWGRVPVDKCLLYARNVLHSVILPLHQYYINGTESEFLSGEINGKHKPKTYQSMCDLYESKLYWLAGQLESNCFDDQLRRSLDSLSLAVRQVQNEAKRISSLAGRLPAVICHMDYQPQNLLFYKKNNISCTASVLDWEEAAWADPRFELLLLGRKVCANQEQAHQLWKEYEENMTGVKLGSLEPWLMLESVHSITSIMLQAAGAGGRSPWESKVDLFGKLQREFQRLSIDGLSLLQIE